jgi:hypothetical protein
MLNAIPNTWFSWNFSLEEVDGTPVTDLSISTWKDRGSVSLRDGLRYLVCGRRFSPLVLEAADGSEVAYANGLGWFRNGFAVTHGERRYTLKPIRWIGREHGVFAEGRDLGRVCPVMLFSRRGQAEIADEVPLVLQAFLVWLTLLEWKRDWDAGTMSKGGT